MLEILARLNSEIDMLQLSRPLSIAATTFAASSSLIASSANLMPPTVEVGTQKSPLEELVITGALFDVIPQAVKESSQHNAIKAAKSLKGVLDTYN